MNCKFCESVMRPLTPPVRILLCDGCNYFETDKANFQGAIYGTLEYPPQCSSGRSFPLSPIGGDQ